jgi:hypothetical protein
MLAVSAFLGISLKYAIHTILMSHVLLIMSLIKFIWSSILFFIYFISENRYENLFEAIKNDGYFTLIFLKMEMMTSIVSGMVFVFLIYSWFCMPKYSTGVVNYAVPIASYGTVVSVARKKTQFNIIKTDKHERRYAPNVLVINKLAWIKIFSAIISSILLIIGIHHSVITATSSNNIEDIVNCTHNSAIRYIKNCTITSAISYYITCIYYAINVCMIKKRTPIANTMVMIVLCVSKVWSYYLYMNISYFDCGYDVITDFYGLYSIVEIDTWSAIFCFVIPCTILSTNRNYFIDTKYPTDTELEIVAYSNSLSNENIVNAINVPT